MQNFAKNFGQLGAISFIVAFSFFIIKLYNRKLRKRIKEKLPSADKVIGSITKFIIKIHKPAGVLALILTSIHFFLMYSSGRIRYSGLFALTILTLLVITGVLKGFVKSTDSRKRLQKAHLLLAFVQLIAVFIHLVFV